MSPTAPRVASLSHVKYSGSGNPWDVVEKPEMSASKRRISWPGGSVTHNKPEALFKFLLRKQKNGEYLSEKQMQSLTQLLKKHGVQGAKEHDTVVAKEALALVQSDFVSSKKRQELLKTYSGTVVSRVEKKAVLRVDVSTTQARVRGTSDPVPVVARAEVPKSVSSQSKVVKLGSGATGGSKATAGSGIVRCMDLASAPVRRGVVVPKSGRKVVNLSGISGGGKRQRVC